MNFSLIIINYQTLEITKNCLNSILSFCNSLEFEIILIDNNSGDGSIETLEKEFRGKIRIIKNRENIGFAAANNQGAKMARGKYLFFLNSDTIITDNILAPLFKILEENKSTGILAPRLLNSDKSLQDKSYGAYPRLMDLILSHFIKKEKIPSERTNSFEVDWLSGAALIIRHELFKRIGGWDNKFFMYFEDVDLCRRTKDANYKIIIAPSVSLIHLSGKSLSKNNKRKYYYYASQNYYFKKHYGLLSLLILKIIRWPYKTARKYKK